MPVLVAYYTQDLRNDGGNHRCRHAVQSLSSGGLLSPPWLLLHSGAFHSNFSCVLLDAICVC